MTFSSRNDAIISQLDPLFAEMVKQLLTFLSNLGEDILLTSGKRTPAEQHALFQQGRTVPGEVVTDDDYDESNHVYGVAVDFVPVAKGEPDYSDDARIQKIARIAVGLNFDWGFALWGFDKCHLQYTQGLTITDFRKGAHLKHLPTQQIEYPNPAIMTPQVKARLEDRITKKGPPAVAKRTIQRLNKKK